MEVLEVPKSEMVELLRSHRLLGDAPAEELEWIAERGVLQRFGVGDVTASPDRGPMTEMFIFLSGLITLYLDRGGLRKAMTWRGGDVGGLLPYSRMTTPPGAAKVEEPMDAILLDKEHFTGLTRECPVVTSRLVGLMLDRTRHFTKYDLQDEKMKSLGRLSAGLAHEMDNPASAVIRSAKLLVPLLDEADAAARELGAAGIAAEQYAFIEQLRNGCLNTPISHVRSPLEQARHEEEISDWVEDREVEVASLEALADSPVTVEMLEQLEDRVERRVLGLALRWVASGCALRSLAAELGEAATRISHLVKAVKGFTQMDATGAATPVDVATGLMQTLAVMKSKARSKSVRVSIQSPPDLPRIVAVAGELNQVWANLIDNALDAVAEGGSVQISAERAGDLVIVRVVDDGPGISPKDIDRVFDPFFTTKPVGSGTGLGLDIVRRLVSGNDGSIEVESVPGRTEFRVSFPVYAGSTSPSVEQQA